MVLLMNFNTCEFTWGQLPLLLVWQGSLSGFSPLSFPIQLESKTPIFDSHTGSLVDIQACPYTCTPNVIDGVKGFFKIMLDPDHEISLQQEFGSLLPGHSGFLQLGINAKGYTAESFPVDFNGVIHVADTTMEQYYQKLHQFCASLVHKMNSAFLLTGNQFTAVILYGDSFPEMFSVSIRMLHKEHKKITAGEFHAAVSQMLSA
jgi:hypothetical protein